MSAVTAIAQPNEQGSQLFETLRLKSGGYAVKAHIRLERPILVYGFRCESEAWDWIERTSARLAE
jgi:hypothetical protein